MMVKSSSTDRKVTVWVAIVCSEPIEAFLLLKRSKKVKNPGLWNFPGGNVDPGDTIINAAIRELREEIGRRVSADELDHVAHMALPNKDVHGFLLRRAERVFPILNDEHTKHAWVTKSWMNQHLRDLHAPTRLLVEQHFCVLEGA